MPPLASAALRKTQIPKSGCLGENPAPPKLRVPLGKLLSTSVPVALLNTNVKSEALISTCAVVRVEQ